MKSKIFTVISYFVDLISAQKWFHDSHTDTSQMNECTERRRKMTAMGIELLKLAETQRSNREREAETARSNRENESIKRADTAENVRYHTLMTDETKRNNVAMLGETVRSNRAREDEQKRYNNMYIGVQSRQAAAKESEVGETRRHNRVTESLDREYNLRSTRASTLRGIGSLIGGIGSGVLAIGKGYSSVRNWRDAATF